MPPRRSGLSFAVTNLIVWVVMVAMLVVVPDVLGRWVPFEVARVVGWAMACGVWVVTVERSWQERFGPVARFVFQLVLWVSAALLAIWISESTVLT